MRSILFILIFSLSSVCNAGNYSSIIDVLKEVETNNNIDAIGDNGKAFGILQIHKICIDDVNRYYNTNYTHQDAFNEDCAEEIFRKYINIGVGIYIRKYNKFPSEKDIVRMWNGGVYKGYLRKSTLKYYRRYLRFKNN